MAEYLYRCPDCGREDPVSHGMFEIVAIPCPTCGTTMRKRPQALTIKRSCFIEPSPAISRHLANIDRHRDETAAKYAARKAS